MESFAVASEHYTTPEGKVIIYQRKYRFCNDIWGYIKEFMLEDKGKFNYLYYVYKNIPFRWFGLYDYHYDYYDEYDEYDIEPYDNIKANFGNCDSLKRDLFRILNMYGLKPNDILNQNIDASKYFHMLDYKKYGTIIDKIERHGVKMVKKVTKNNLITYYKTTNNKFIVNKVIYPDNVTLFDDSGYDDSEEAEYSEYEYDDIIY